MDILPRGKPSDQREESPSGSSVRVNGKPGRGSSEVDPFDEAYDWLFVVLKRDDVRTLMHCTEPGLDVACSTQRKLTTAAVNREVIVVTPSHGPGRAEAKELADKLRPHAKKVVEWIVPELGNDDTPTLKAVDEKYSIEGASGIAKILAFQRPWLGKSLEPSASSNGNGHIPATNGNGKQHSAEGGRRSYDFLQALTDEQLGIVRASSIEIKPIDWLWEYRLAAGEFAMMAGEPGLGKSQVMLAIASAITQGSDWPGGQGRAPVGSVVILSAEDRPETTIIPRLKAMNADVGKVVILRAKVIRRQEGKECTILPMSFQDHEWWRVVFDRTPDARMLIADPIVSYLGKGVNDQRNTELRDILEPFIEEIIRPRGICFLGNTHLNKSIDSKSPLNRISGSTAYGALPRNVHFVVKDPDNPKQRYFKQCKCNNAPDDLEAIPFQVEQRILSVGDIRIETSVPIFAEKGIKLDLQQVLGGDKGRRGPKPVKTNEVAEWLYERLTTTPMMMRDLVQQAQEAGYVHLPTERHPKPSISILYDAMERLETVRPGWKVEVSTVEAGVGPNRKPRQRWALVRVNGAESQPALPAF